MTDGNEQDCLQQNGTAGLLTIKFSYALKQLSMSFSAVPVFLAFILNRCSIRFFTTCRCILGFTPYSASLLFGLSLVAILVKHPELYPCWLRRVNVKIMFLYELFVSLVFIEVGFCLWNSLETFIFFKVPSFFEEHCITIGEYYISMVESPVGVSLISNLLATTLLLFILHVTKVCNFSLLLKTNGVHKFFADAGLTSKICRHHREMRESQMEFDHSFVDPICSPAIVGRSIPQTFSRNSITHCHSPKMLRRRRISLHALKFWETPPTRELFPSQTSIGFT